MKEEKQDAKKIKSQLSRGGAPKKNENEKKKHRFVAFFKMEEKKNIKEKMRKWGYKNFSTLCEDILIKKRLKVLIVPVFCAEAEEIFNKMGVNLNQIARNLNSNILMDPEYLRQILEEIRSAQTTIIIKMKEMVRL